MKKEEFINRWSTMGASGKMAEDLDSVIQQAIAEEKEKTCKFIYDAVEYKWTTACCKEIQDLDADDSYEYCPFCGHKIERV